MAKVELKEVVKRYGTVEVVHGADLSIRNNEFLVMVGPSGCGKSTVLRMIAGLEPISGGDISINDVSVTNLAPKDRNVAMVFQNYALYPHMSVHDNMGFSLKMAKESKEEIEKKVRQAAEILELTPYLDRKPGELSGGQRQRVAMGRAIVRRPAVFLFDEPLSNLDAQLRTQMRIELKKLHQKMQTTTIYVTHDQVEAMTLADRIVILRDGYVQQIGSPIEVFERPANRFVAGFIGNPPINMFSGVMQVNGGESSVRVGEMLLPAPGNPGLQDGAKVEIGIRPDSIRLASEQVPGADHAALSGTVMLSEVLGGQSLLQFATSGNTMIAELPGRVILPTDETAELSVDVSRMLFFDPGSGEAIYRE